MSEHGLCVQVRENTLIVHSRSSPHALDNLRSAMAIIAARWIVEL